MSWHSGRSFSGTQIEDSCPCPKESCGLVDLGRADPDCPDHWWERAKTLRQGHPADRCPAEKPEEPEATE